jgi:hypothetical protein
MIINVIKNFILKIPHYLNIALHLHSKAPNNEIKKIWEILAVGGLPFTLLTLFSGVKILWFIPVLKIDFINDNGVWIFFIFIIVYCVVFFDYKKCKDITAKEHKKYGKP